MLPIGIKAAAKVVPKLKSFIFVTGMQSIQEASTKRKT